MRSSVAAPRRQHGAFLITFALFMLFLLGFMGIALDFSRLFVVKTELQTAMDSCALAAARELNGQTDAIARAQSAGMASGNGNKANLQSSNWNGVGKIVSGDITFLDKDYAATTVPAAARYAECRYTMSNIQLWLLQAMGAFSGDSATWPGTGTVGARAVATRASAQSACPIPVALPLAKFSTLNVGDWVPLLDKTKSGSDFGWANLDGSKDANSTKDQVDGYCGTKPGDVIGTKIGTNGVQATVVEIWNYRFGIYKDATDKDKETKETVSSPSIHRPDFTGYVYNTSTWPKGRDAYSDFVAKRQAFTPCGTTPTDCGMSNGGGFSYVATSQQHKDYGADRRVVLVPVTDTSSAVVDFACMLMLQPMTIPVGTVELEYRGKANAVDSPCTTTGLAGGSNGPLVPVLVR
ncbi:TadE/TadG family type IV pilus assembly protein [Comamonas sp. w2-DMI]